jgi:ferredoxin
MVKVDKEKCIGCGACEALCPEGFKLEDGKARVLNQKAKCIKEAKDACPVQAIK